MHAYAVSSFLGTCNHPPAANIYPANPCTSFLLPQVENPTLLLGSEHLKLPWELIAPPQDCQEVL